MTSGRTLQVESVTVGSSPSSSFGYRRLEHDNDRLSLNKTSGEYVLFRGGEELVFNNDESDHENDNLLQFGESNYIKFPGSSTPYNEQYYLYLMKSGENNSEINLSYLSYGLRGSDPYYPSAYFIFGVGTDFSSIPKTGTAEYRGIADGIASEGSVSDTYHLTGISSVEVDFAQMSLRNKLNLSGLSVDGSGKKSREYSFSGSAGISQYYDGIQFKGSIAENSDDDLYGEFFGKFFGPSADELGYSFEAYNHESRGATVALAGVVVAEKTELKPAPLPTAPALSPLTLDEALAGGERLNAELVHVFSMSAGVFGYRLKPHNYASISYEKDTDTYTFINEFHEEYSYGPDNIGSGYDNLLPLGIENYKTFSSSGNEEKDKYLYMMKGGEDNSEIQLTYMSYGIQGRGDTYPDIYFIFGAGTDISSIPKTGTATYSGIADGIAFEGNERLTYHVTGTSSIEVDFAQTSLHNTLVLSGTSIDGEGRPSPNYNFSGSGKVANYANGIQFNGEMTDMTDSTLYGEFFGRFFGPSAEELGYSFQTYNHTPLGSNIAVGGVVVAKKVEP